jgi:hypothetical protein
MEGPVQSGVARSKTRVRLPHSLSRAQKQRQPTREKYSAGPANS